jgi:hypothetical protein
MKHFKLKKNKSPTPLTERIVKKKLSKYRPSFVFFKKVHKIEYEINLQELHQF